VVKRIPLTPPNVDSATHTGIIHAMKPYMRWANVCHTYIHNCKVKIKVNMDLYSVLS